MDEEVKDRWDYAKLIRIIIVLIFAAVVYFLAPLSMPEAARRVLFVFIVAALFWVLELVPLYATSLIVVFSQIILLCRPNGVLGMDQAGYKVFLASLGSPIIVLFLGGLVLAAALHKYAVDRLIAGWLLGFFGDKPYFVLCGFMLTTALLSMWMSDTATAAMMIAMVIPLLKQLKETDPFRTALILSIPFSALIGGMATPIGTPPNAIAIGILADYNIHITFFSWMKMAVPLAGILLLITSFVLIGFFPPEEKSLSLNIHSDGVLHPRRKSVILIAMIIILLWLTSGLHGIPSAVVALLAVTLFTVTGLFDRSDLNLIGWDVLILMWGGLALGKGMQISGLTDWIIHLSIFQQQGYVLVVVFCVFGAFLSTFMSNTATASLLIPIVMMIPGENNIVLAVTIALSCSLAMALPVSTPPNAIAFSTNMVRSKDMLKAGAVISIISVLVILLGFNLMVEPVLGL